jgi:hypothetical protein
VNNWKCPQCGLQNSIYVINCSCGYSVKYNKDMSIIETNGLPKKVNNYTWFILGVLSFLFHSSNLGIAIFAEVNNISPFMRYQLLLYMPAIFILTYAGVSMNTANPIYFIILVLVNGLVWGIIGIIIGIKFPRFQNAILFWCILIFILIITPNLIGGIINIICPDCIFIKAT